MPRFMQTSRRINDTDAPVIAFTRRAMKLHPDPLSLAQGVVHWPPPPEALEAVMRTLSSADPTLSQYGANEGLPALREALRKKVSQQNGLHDYDICVTHGGNQAFVNLVLSLVDEGDQVVLFRPAYFDHIMVRGKGSNMWEYRWASSPYTVSPRAPPPPNADHADDGGIPKHRVRRVRPFLPQAQH